MESLVGKSDTADTSFCVEGYDYQFFEPGGPSDIQKCPICHLVVRNAYQVNCCGKILCEGCLMRLCEFSDKCPMCRESIGDKYFKDTKSTREINHLKVFCDYKRTGCEWSGQLSDIESHKDKCLYQSVSCIDCEQAVLKLDLMKHMTLDCFLRKHNCPLCHVQDTYLNITSKHQSVCPEVLVECSNHDCTQSIKRRQISSHIETCPKQVIKCPFSHMGCDFWSVRENLATHIENTVASHVDMVARQIHVHQRVLPVVLKLSAYTHLKQLKKKWYSDCVYTGEGGYKLRLLVYPNGNGKGESTHLSLVVTVMPGANDDIVEWPMRGVVTVTLLNQLRDDQHVGLVISLDDSVPEKYRSRKCEPSDSGRGKQRFIPNACLQFNPDTNTQYLMDDTLYFRVTATVASGMKTWLAVQ